MTPYEFALWMNGATGVIEDVPNNQQWARIKEKLEQTIGDMAKEKLIAAPVLSYPPGAGAVSASGFPAAQQAKMDVFAAQTKAYASKLQEYASKLQAVSK